MGEASSKSRPMNALLEEELEVEYASKPVPIITPDTTQSLEEKIKARIVDSAFDDVIRRQASETQKPRPRRVEMDDSKSGKSLVEVYEQEYMASNTKSVDKPVETPESHKEIAAIFTKLCGDLDALSNFHFTPRAPKQSVEVVVSAPAITVEEVMPASTSNASLLAPTEVYGGKLTDGSGERKTGKRKNKKRKIVSEKKKVDAGTKNGAIKELMGMNNVTIIGGESKVNGKKVKGYKAATVEKGGKIGEKAVEESAVKFRL